MSWVRPARYQKHSLSVIIATLKPLNLSTPYRNLIKKTGFSRPIQIAAQVLHYVRPCGGPDLRPAIYKVRFRVQGLGLRL